MTSPDFPPAIYELFPLTFIFYRKNKPKLRKGTHSGMDGNTKVFTKHKRSTTAHQNNYSYVVCPLTDPNNFGTLQRSLAHKGYGTLISAVWATDEEVEMANTGYRIMYWKYKSISEIYNARKLDDPQWKEMCERLDRLYPTRSSGQLTLH